MSVSKQNPSVHAGSIKGGVTYLDMEERKAAASHLRAIVEEAKRYWDERALPYPPHLQSAIDFLARTLLPSSGADDQATD